MRARRRIPQLVVAIGTTLIFLAVSVTPRFTPRAEANEAAPPLPVPEDPLGQQPEQQTPEISINVDVRDGHLTVRVVDLWGPGRTPFVVRSYTNTPSSSTSAVGDPRWGGVAWQLNQHADIVGLEPDAQGRARLSVREPDGNRGVYVYSTTRWSADQREKWDVYTKSVGTSSTLEMRSTCVPGDPPGPGGHAPQPTPQLLPRPQARPSPAVRPQPLPALPVRQVGRLSGLECSWDGLYWVYLPKGVVRRFARNNTYGLIQEDRDANGNVTTYTWRTFPDGIRAYIERVRDAVGRETVYAYERAWDVCVRENDRGDCLEWKWHYRVRTVTDPWGRVATYTYDAQGRLVSVTNGAGRITAYSYPTGPLGTVTNARGHTTTIQSVYDGAWRVTRVTAPDGAATTYAYTVHPSSKQVTRTVVTNARGHATTHDFYSGTDENYFGNLMQVTAPLGNVTQFTYDARHNITQVTDPRGNRTTYAYNSRNKVTQAVRAAGTLNLTTTATWDAHDNLLSVVNPRGIRTEYTYDARHNLTHVRKAVGTPDASTTQYVYNAWGGVTQVIDPRGNPTAYTYTARRQVQQIIPPVGGGSTFGYDAFDDQVTKTDGNGRTWTTEYDASRLVIRQADPLTYAVRHAYDANGNRTATWDAKNQATTFTYDSRDRLTQITDPLNGQTRYAYDAVSNLTQLTNARNHATTFAYDAANRLTQVRDALQQLTTYQYDAAGNRTGMTDRKGQGHTYAYDQVNRLTQVSAGGQTIAYTYDATGNRLTLVDSTGTTSFQYDRLDRLTRTTTPDGRLVQATYDQAGNRTSLTNPGGITTTAVYDGANRLSQMTQGTLTWTFTYDAAGNRTRLTHPNGTSTDYAYLNNHWLQSITDKAPGGATFQSTSYGYDQNGNRTSQADPSGATTFTYDALNRLTQAAYPAGYGTWSWVYDPVGNRTQQTGPGGTTNYTYDANNRLLTAGSTTYSYDQNGNLLSISTGQTFTWDVFNRLTQATGPGGTVTHTYDGDGLKTRRVGPDGTRRYYYDGIRPIWETDAAGAMTAQYDRDIFGNLLSRREASGARRYYHFDGLGSTTALTNESGAATSTLLYDAWGNQRAATGSDQGRYRFTGAELDAATGLYHMHARFYDPTIGRWLSEDPVQDKPFEPATLNFYAYVYSSPLNHLDPDGKVAVWAVTGAIGFVVGVGVYLGTHQGTATLGGALAWGAAGALIGMGLGAAAQSLLAAQAAGSAVIAATSARGVPITMNARLATRLSEGWTSVNNFMGHFADHAAQVAKAFGKASITGQEYAALAREAFQRAGGRTGIVRLTFNGVDHWVRIVVNEFGEIVTFHPSGPPPP